MRFWKRQVEKVRTYGMWLRCFNCGDLNEYQLPYGEPFQGQAVTCTNCGYAGVTRKD